MTSAMSLSDDDIRALLRDPGTVSPCAAHMGFELLDFSVDGRWTEVAYTPIPAFANPAGNVQGGFITAMLDECMSVNATIASRFTSMLATLQMTVTYLRPVPVSRVVSRGEVLRMGTSAILLQGSLRSLTGETLAVATASAVPRPFPVRPASRTATTS